MCDYSLHSVKSRPAMVGDKLVTNNFGTGTRGFAEAGSTIDSFGCVTATAVCVLPGTELAFAKPIEFYGHGPTGVTLQTAGTTAIFRQINREVPTCHHDCLEFSDGARVLLTNLAEGQEATVLQMPINPEARLPYNEGQATAQLPAECEPVS